MARVGIAVAALIVGGALVYSAPETSDVTKPIAFHGTVGDRITGRAFATTVTRLTFANRLELRDGTRVETPGIWLVVEAAATARLHNVALGASTLTVGGKTYGAYDDPDDRDLSAPLRNPGITVEGSLAFELPRTVATASDAELVLDRGTLNPDQVNVVAVHPNRVRHVDEASIVPQNEVGAVVQ